MTNHDLKFEMRKKVLKKVYTGSNGVNGNTHFAKKKPFFWQLTYSLTHSLAHSLAHCAYYSFTILSHYFLSRSSIATVLCLFSTVLA